MNAAIEVGRRKGIHRPDHQRSKHCNVRDADGRPVSEEELRLIVDREPRRLCGHCYPTKDRSS